MPRGGKREGAGPPRRYVPRGILVPPAVLAQLQEIADAEGWPLAEVVKEAILRFISDWQDEHDAGAVPPRPSSGGHDA
jgi:hypothetical protein